MKLRIKNINHEPRNGFDKEEWPARTVSDWVKAGFDVHVQIERDMENDPVITVREPGGDGGEDFPDDCATRESFIIEKCRKVKDGYISITVRDNDNVEYLTMREYERNFRQFCEDSEPFEPGRWEYHQGDGRKNLLNHATEYYNDGKVMIVREEDSDVTLAIRGRI